MKNPGSDIVNLGQKLLPVWHLDPNQPEHWPLILRSVQPEVETISLLTLLRAPLPPKHSRALSYFEPNDHVDPLLGLEILALVGLNHPDQEAVSPLDAPDTAIDEEPALRKPERYLRFSRLPPSRHGVTDLLSRCVPILRLANSDWSDLYPRRCRYSNVQRRENLGRARVTRVDRRQDIPLLSPHDAGGCMRKDNGREAEVPAGEGLLRTIQKVCKPSFAREIDIMGSKIFVFDELCVDARRVLDCDQKRIFACGRAGCNDP